MPPPSPVEARCLWRCLRLLLVLAGGVRGLSMVLLAETSVSSNSSS